MASIIKKPTSVFNALSFIERFVNSPYDYLYVGIGRSTSWSDDSNPPAPSDTVQEMTNFWDDLIGIEKLGNGSHAFSFMVPRVDWVQGDEYYEFDETSDAAYNTKFYVKNSENYVYKVYSKDNTSPPPTAQNEPTGTGSGNPIDTGDGYQWLFLYDMNSDQVDEFLNVDWMPVSWGPSETTNQTNDGDPDAYKTLWANHIIIKEVLEDTNLPIDTSYRQVGLILNPNESASGTPQATDENYLQSELDMYSGELLYLENRTPVYRKSGQNEDIRIIFEF